MKVGVVYTENCRQTKLLMDDIARYAKTYALPVSSFDYNEQYDLLIIGYEECLKYGQLYDFISQLSRSNIKNLVIMNMFYFSNKEINKVMSYCRENDLPLMRECFSAKAILKRKVYQLNDDIIFDARVFIEDMINLCINYY